MASIASGIPSAGIGQKIGQIYLNSLIKPFYHLLFFRSGIGQSCAFCIYCGAEAGEADDATDPDLEGSAHALRSRPESQSLLNARHAAPPMA